MIRVLLLIVALLFMPFKSNAEMTVGHGETSQLIEIFIPDSSSTTGAGLTGVAFGDVSTAFYYCSGAAEVELSGLQTMTLGTWATEGFIEIDATNMPGWYQFGIPNAALVTGCGDETVFHLEGATDMVPTGFAVLLEVFNHSDLEALVDDIGVAGAGLGDLGGMSTGMKAEVEAEVDDSIGGGTGTAMTAVPWNASWDAEVESEVDDSVGGGTGTALTAVPWNASWDAEVESEVDDAEIYATGTEKTGVSSTTTRLYYTPSATLDEFDGAYMGMCAETTVSGNLERRRIKNSVSAADDYLYVVAFSAAPTDEATINIYEGGCN